MYYYSNYVINTFDNTKPYIFNYSFNYEKLFLENIILPSLYDSITQIEEKVDNIIERHQEKPNIISEQNKLLQIIIDKLDNNNKLLNNKMIEDNKIIEDNNKIEYNKIIEDLNNSKNENSILLKVITKLENYNNLLSNKITDLESNNKILANILDNN